MNAISHRDAVAARIVQLRRRICRARLVAVAVVIAGGAFLALAPGDLPGYGEPGGKVYEPLGCDEFRVEDDKGNVFGKLSVGRDGPELALFDGVTCRARVRADGLWLLDQEGTHGGKVCVWKDASEVCLQLDDQRRKFLMASSEEWHGLRVEETRPGKDVATPRVVLAHLPSTSSSALALFNEDGIPGSGLVLQPARVSLRLGTDCRATERGNFRNAGQADAPVDALFTVSGSVSAPMSGLALYNRGAGGTFAVSEALRPQIELHDAKKSVLFSSPSAQDAAGLHERGSQESGATAPTK